MAKLQIKGCGYCSKSKGCNIKKDFRQLSSKYDQYTEVKRKYYHIGLTYTSKIENIFTLECPFGDRKYNEGDKVEFSLGIQRYKHLTEWECDRDCDQCYDERCDVNGIITFENIRYKQKITVTGNIVNLYKNDKWVIAVDKHEWDKVSKLCNKEDIAFFEKISDTYDPGQEFHMCFISKEKFIKKLNI